MYWCCQPGNGASRVPAKETTGCESLLHSPRFILLLRAWVWGFFHIAATAVSHQPQHTSSMLHTHCHSLPSLILRNFNLFLLLLVLWFCSMSGFWINILPHVWSCISSPWQPTRPSLSSLRWSCSFLASWVTQSLHYPYVLAFHPWSGLHPSLKAALEPGEGQREGVKGRGTGCHLHPLWFTSGLVTKLD